MLIPFLQQVIETYRHGKDCTDDPCRGDGMAELVDGKRRQGHFRERHHLMAHGIGIELTPHGILHPRVGHENPPCRDGGSQSGEPGGSEMESGRHLLPSEIHHRHEGRLHEECHNALDGEGGAEDITHEPRVVAPVGTELKFQDDARGNAHGKVHPEEFLPEFCHVFPEHLFRAVVASLEDAHDEGQSQREGDEQPMVDGSERKLRPRPVNHTGIDV